MRNAASCCIAAVAVQEKLRAKCVYNVQCRGVLHSGGGSIREIARENVYKGAMPRRVALRRGREFARENAKPSA